MASTQVVETSVKYSSPSQDSNHPDDLFQSIVVQSGSLSGDIDYHFQNKVTFVLNFRVIYSSINEFSHSENGPATYSLDQTGNAKYESFIDGIAESLNSQWARNISPEDVSKDDRNFLRLAAVLHVLFDKLTKFLNGGHGKHRIASHCVNISRNNEESLTRSVQKFLLDSTSVYFNINIKFVLCSNC